MVEIKYHVIRASWSSSSTTIKDSMYNFSQCVWNSGAIDKTMGWPYAQCKCMCIPFNVSVPILGIKALVLIKCMLYLQDLTLDERVEMPSSATLPR